MLRQSMGEACVVAPVDERCWGASVFEEPAPGVRRLLGIHDLWAKFEGRKDRRGREVGWAMALMEMPVDPLLVAWVPAWAVSYTHLTLPTICSV